MHPSEKAPSRRALRAGLIGAAVIALLAFAVWRVSRPAARAPRDALAGASLMLQVRLRRGNRSWTYDERHAARPGDRMRFIVDTGRSGFLYLVGLRSDRAEATLYAPFVGPPRRLRAGRGQVIGGAIELGRARQELIFALLCRKRIAARVVKQHASRWLTQGRAARRSLDVPPTLALPCDVSSVLLQVQGD